jgi:hypothetical protein
LVAFTRALAPLVVALLFFWALMIPVFAVIFGAVPYLVFGTPIQMWTVTRFPIKDFVFAIGGAAAQFLFACSLRVLANLRPDLRVGDAGFMAIWGIPFAIGWFIAFAHLYRRFYRPVAR